MFRSGRESQMLMQYACLQCVHVYSHLESFCILMYVQREGCGVTCSSHVMCSVSLYMCNYSTSVCACSVFVWCADIIMYISVICSKWSIRHTYE